MIFAWFNFVFEGNFRVQPPRGAYIWRGKTQPAQSSRLSEKALNEECYC